MNMPFYILDENKNVRRATMEEHVAWFMANPDRQVDFTELDGVRISTVFLPVVNGFGDNAVHPLAFETMVFGGIYSYQSWKCRTWDNALQQHAYVVGLIKGYLDSKSQVWVILPHNVLDLTDEEIRDLILDSEPTEKPLLKPEGTFAWPAKDLNGTMVDLRRRFKEFFDDIKRLNTEQH